MIGDPTAAPPRTDLPFLRRRSRPRVVQPAPAPAAPRVPQPAQTPSGPRVDYTHPRRQRQPSTQSEPAKPPGVDYTRRGRSRTGAPEPASSSLDLSGPPAPAPATPPAAPPATSDPAQSHAGSLDLSDQPDAPATGTPHAPPAPKRRQRRAVRVSGRVQHLLTRVSPTVTLTRVQSGVGNLTIEAVVGSAVGDLRLAAAYQLRSGGSSVVALTLGHRFAPPSGRRPALVAGRENGSERIGIDLRQIREIQRVGILAFSESRQSLTWGGTLVVTTYGGARIELPLESLYPGTSAMLMSLYNVDGELVIRAEMETLAGDVRETARAYGYDRITWRDDRNTVD